MNIRDSGVLALCMLLSGPVSGDSLRSWYVESRCERFAGVSPDEMRRAQSVFTTALKGENLDSPELAAAWQALGFEWLRVSGPGNSYWIAREPPKGCRGRGFYAFSDNSSLQTVLQVPHRFRDRYTGTIALEMVRAGRFRAIAWNTAPRRIETGTGMRNADLAHRWDSDFVAFTEAFANALPQGRLIQLHGFASGKRSTAAAATADIIVSAGSRWPGAQALAVSTCLERVYTDGVRLYPRDTVELGATRNVQGRLLRGRGHSGFVHVELSEGLRGLLGDDRESLQSLCHCLTETER